MLSNRTMPKLRALIRSIRGKLAQRLPHTTDKNVSNARDEWRHQRLIPNELVKRAVTSGV
jgi:hypothetical protein